MTSDTALALSNKFSSRNSLIKVVVVGSGDEWISYSYKHMLTDGGQETFYKGRDSKHVRLWGPKGIMTAYFCLCDVKAAIDSTSVSGHDCVLLKFYL